MQLNAHLLRLFSFLFFFFFFCSSLFFLLLLHDTVPLPPLLSEPMSNLQASPCCNSTNRQKSRKAGSVRDSPGLLPSMTQASEQGPKHGACSCMHSYELRRHDRPWALNRALHSTSMRQTPNAANRGSAKLRQRFQKWHFPSILSVLATDIFRLLLQF